MTAPNLPVSERDASADPREREHGTSGGNTGGVVAREPIEAAELVSAAVLRAMQWALAGAGYARAMETEEVRALLAALRSSSAAPSEQFTPEEIALVREQGDICIRSYGYGADHTAPPEDDENNYGGYLVGTKLRAIADKMARFAEPPQSEGL